MKVDPLRRFITWASIVEIVQSFLRLYSAQFHIRKMTSACPRLLRKLGRGHRFAMTYGVEFIARRKPSLRKYQELKVFRLVKIWETMLRYDLTTASFVQQWLREAIQPLFLDSKIFEDWQLGSYLCSLLSAWEKHAGPCSFVLESVCNRWENPTWNFPVASPAEGRTELIINHCLQNGTYSQKTSRSEYPDMVGRLLYRLDVRYWYNWTRPSPQFPNDQIEDTALQFTILVLAPEVN